MKQGPYRKKPVGIAPKVGIYSGRWLQCPDGTWWAFYNDRVGPDTGEWNVAHTNDMSWWKRAESDATVISNYCCRHGHQSPGCPDGSCGKEPRTDTKTVVDTVRGLQRILGEDAPRYAVRESDLRETVVVIDLLNAAVQTPNSYIAKATVVLHDLQDEEMGVLSYEGESEWTFLPSIVVEARDG